MTRYHPAELVPGMRLARSIHVPDGRVLLRGGVELLPRYIERLRSMGIPAVYILDPGEQYVESDVISAATRARAVQDVVAAFNSVAIGRRLDLPSLDASIDAMLEDILSTRSPVLGIFEIESCDHYTFTHSVNVCVISLMLGIQLRLSMHELRLLGMGALLHDIGKIHLPPSILKKEGRLSEAEIKIMQGHTKRGFDHLRVYSDLSLLSALVAYQHHERMDGSGYPRGLVGDRIHQYSRIVMVADVYDAMTSNRVYRTAVAPIDVLQHVQTEQGVKFASDVVHALAQIVAPYPTGAKVRLNTGEVARVLEVNPVSLERPRIRVIQTGRKGRLSVPFDIDLQLDMSRLIVGALNG